MRQWFIISRYRGSILNQLIQQKRTDARFYKKISINVTGIHYVTKIPDLYLYFRVHLRKDKNIFIYNRMKVFLEYPTVKVRVEFMINGFAEVVAN